MKTAFAILAALPLALQAANVVVDKAAHSVSFEVVSCDPGSAAPIEFLVVGPDSDHAYESLFQSVATVKELADAFDKAGFPRGNPVDYRACKFWPVGSQIEIEPNLWSLVKDIRGEEKAPVVYTGGLRMKDGSPDAHANMPQAVFALYDLPQSLFQFDDSLQQSPTYGRFIPAVVIPEKEKRILKFTWKGTPPPQKIELVLEPGKLQDAITLLKEKTKEGDIEVVPRFSPDMTLAQAAETALALSVVDSVRVKISGFVEGQFFYRSFMPLEKWRDRTERLTQPYELRLSNDAPMQLTTIKEDWSVSDAIDPKLIITENASFDSIGKEGDITDTCLIFAPKSMKLAEIFKVRSLMPPKVVNYYVYGE